MKNKIIVVGGFQEIFELCHLCGFEVTGYIDNAALLKETPVPLLGCDEDAIQVFSEYGRTHSIIITPDQPAIRERLFMTYQDIGFKVASLLSPKALISPTAQLNEGCIVQSFCHVSAHARIGKGVKMSVYANVMHDVSIANYVTIAPGAILLGNVQVGEGAYIGAGAVVLPRIKIGKGAIVGAGAVVTKNVEDGITVVGVPATKMLHH
jgi:sugar O-acyltransferase (sialic acid O-acetyltransferase NeuD family)